MSFVPNNQFIATLARFASKFSALDSKIAYNKRWIQTASSSSVSFCPVPKVSLEPIISFAFSAQGVNNAQLTMTANNNSDITILKVSFPFTVYGGYADIANGILRLTHFGKVAQITTYEEDSTSYTFTIPLVKSIAEDAESSDVKCYNLTSPTISFTAGLDSITLNVLKENFTVGANSTVIETFNSLNVEVAYKLDNSIDVTMNRYILTAFDPVDKYGTNSHTVSVNTGTVSVGYMPYCDELS